LQDVRDAFFFERYKFSKQKEDAMKAFQWRVQQEATMYRKVMLQKYISPPEIVLQYQAIEH